LLNDVIKKEKIKISEDAKLVLCELANNSARDLLSLLEQLIQINKNITLKLIEETFLLSNKERIIIVDFRYAKSLLLFSLFLITSFPYCFSYCTVLYFYL
jgi:replication-associated recombination protein RarA